MFSELLQPTSRPGANLSAQNNVTRNIPPCFSGKMQIGSSPLVRRSLDKALPEPRSLFGVFPAWNVMVGGSEGRTWSRQHEDGDVRGPPQERCCSQCPSLLHSSMRFVRCQLCSAPSAPLSLSLPALRVPTLSCCHFRATETRKGVAQVRGAAEPCSPRAQPVTE